MRKRRSTYMPPDIILRRYRVPKNDPPKTEGFDWGGAVVIIMGSWLMAFALAALIHHFKP